MSKPLVILESPYAGDIARNLKYLKRAMIDCVLRDEVPFASHALFTTMLDDTKQHERAMGIELGYALWPHAAKLVFYTDYGFSMGMQDAWEKATNDPQLQATIEVRKIGTNS